jgi:hypothetical protein
VAYADPTTGLPTNTPPSWLANLPTMPAPAAPPQGATGFWGNPIVSGVASGTHELLGNVYGRLPQAVGAATGIQSLQDLGQRISASQDAAAAAASRPDLEGSPFSSFSAAGYNLAKALPTLATAIGGGEALGGLGLLTGAGRLAQAARFGVPMLPSAIGSNVQESTGPTSQNITQSEGLKAIALGVPEALGQGFVPGGITQMFEKGIAGNWAKRALIGGGAMGAYGAAASGAQTAVMDAAYHPELPFVDRAQHVVDSALAGGFQGAFFGGLTGLASRVKPTDDTDAIKGAVDQALQIPGQEAPAETPPAQPELPAQLAAPPDQAALAPPEKVGATPLPDNLATAPSDTLKAAHDAMAQQDNMDQSQVGQMMAFREELAKRTQPGLKPGEGNLFTPEDVASRQPQVDAVKASLDLPAKAQDTPFFKNLNAADEPDLINAIDAQLKTYDRVTKADATPDRPAQAEKKIPDWLVKIADDRGLLNDGKKPPEVPPDASPLSWKLEDLGVDKTQAEKVRDALRPVGGEDLRNANARVLKVNDDIDKFTKLDALHQEAAARLTDAVTPKDPETGEPIAQPGRVEPQPRAAPEGLAPEIQKRWDDTDALVRGNNSDEIKNQALAHQQALENGLRGRDSVTKTSQLKLLAAKERSRYTDDDRSWSDPNADIQRSAAPEAVDPAATGAVPEVASGDAGGTVAGPRGEATTPEAAAQQRATETPLQQLAGAPAVDPTLIQKPVTVKREPVVKKSVLNPKQEAPIATAKIKAGPALDYVMLKEAHDQAAPGPEKDALAKALVRGVSGDVADRTAVKDALANLAQKRKNFGTPAASKASDLIAADGKGWSQSAADEVRGHVAHEDKDNALIAGKSFFGRDMYSLVNRATNVRTIGDIGTAKVPWLNDAGVAKYRAIADKSRAADASALKTKPDGPFNGKAGQVTTSVGVKPQLGQLAREWLQGVGLGHLRVALVHETDTRGDTATEHGFNGPYSSARTAGKDSLEYGHMRPFGPDMNDAYIYLRSGMSDAQTIQTLGHEVGHIMEQTLFRNSAPEVKQAVMDAYQAWLKSTTGMKAQELIRSTRNSEMVNNIFTEDAPLSAMDKASQDYITSFPEWFSDHVGRALTNDEQPRSPVQKFFASVAQAWKTLLGHITGNQYLPDEAVAKFLDQARAVGRQDQWANVIGNRSAFGRIPGDDAASSARTPMAAEQTVKDGIGIATTMASRFMDRVSTLGGKVFKAALPWERNEFMFRNARDVLKSGTDYYNKSEMQNVRAQMLDKTDAGSSQEYRALPTPMREAINSMVAKFQNNWQFDFRKDIKDYADDIKKMPDPARATKFFKEGQAQLQALRQVVKADGTNASLVPIMEKMFGMMQTSGLKTSISHMHDLADQYSEKGIKLFGDQYENPLETFRRMPTLHDDPASAHEWFRGLHNAMMKALEGRVADATTRANELMGKDASPASKAQGQKLLDDVQDISNTLSDAHDRQLLINKGTYAPLRRENYDHFVSAKIARGADGMVKPEAIAAIQAKLASGEFKSIGLSHHSESDVLMAKLPSRESMNRLNAVFQELADQGHLSDNKAGYADAPHTMDKFGTPFMQQMVARSDSIAKSLNLDMKQTEALKKKMIAEMMDTVGEHSMLGSEQERDYTSGFDTDMGAAMMAHAMNSNRAATRVASRGEIARASKAMLDEVNAQKSSSMKPSDREKSQDVVNESMRRQTEGQWHVPNGFVDATTSLMHTALVGFNPAYTVTVLSQVATLLHGELTRKYGAAQSAKIIAQVTPEALRIMRAVWSSSDRTSFGMREAALRAAGNISEKSIKTMMSIETAGGFTSYTQAMSELGEAKGKNATYQKWRKYSNLMGIMAEQFPRIIAALSAGALHDSDGGRRAGTTRDDYAMQMVNGSQFKWGPGENSRMLGKKGLFGPLTPIMLGFAQYQTNMIQKLYEEVHEAATNMHGNRAESGRFLASHLAAVVAISGTLGLPGAQFAAGAFDKLYANLTGRDDMDIQGEYRSYLAHTFGPDIADMIAKGAPRGLGVDLSKLGDENIIPGSQFMQDKRRWEDASRDWFKSMAGAGGNQMANMVNSSRDIMNGDFMKGAIGFLPEGIKGLAEATYYSQHGFINKDGTTLPVGNPKALDLVLAALGFDPARLAQYNEANRIVQGLHAEHEYNSQNISQHLMKAQQTGDQAGLMKWMSAAVDMQMHHPGTSGPAETFGSDLNQQMEAGQMARFRNAPIGVGPLDTAGNAASFLTPSGS